MTIQNTGVSAAVSRFLKDGEVGGGGREWTITEGTKEALTVAVSAMKGAVRVVR